MRIVCVVWFEGNKGAAAVSFMFNGTSFCFICCHLTSGHEKLSRFVVVKRPLCRRSRHASVHAPVHVSETICFRDLQRQSMDVCQNCVIGSSPDKDELIRFSGQKVKGQGHIITAEASSTRHCC